MAFVNLKDDIAEAEELKKEISIRVRKVLGPVAYSDWGFFAKDVFLDPCPAKSMRRVIKAQGSGEGDGRPVCSGLPKVLREYTTH